MNFSASPYIVHFNEATLLQTDSRNASHHAEFPVVAWRSGVESKGLRVDNLSIYNYKHSIEIILNICGVYVYMCTLFYIIFTAWRTLRFCIPVLFWDHCEIDMAPIR